MNYLYIDVETLPSADPALIEKIRAGVRAPGQYKKPESIAQWMAENADSAVQEELHKTGLDGLYGSICAISWAIDDAPVQVDHVGSSVETSNEKGLIEWVFTAIHEQSIVPPSNFPSALTLVGHNIEFDVRFLFQRAVRHGLSIPVAMRGAFDADKGRYRMVDTMKLWSGWKGAVKLKDLSRELLGDTNDDIDGADVARVWLESPLKVAQHCQRDVQRVRQLHQMMQGVLS